MHPNVSQNSHYGIRHLYSGKYTCEKIAAESQHTTFYFLFCVFKASMLRAADRMKGKTEYREEKKKTFRATFFSPKN